MYNCSRCGADVGNGGLDKAARVTDLDDNGEIVQRFLCRAKNCAGRVLTRRALAHDHASGTVAQ